MTQSPCLACGPSTFYGRDNVKLLRGFSQLQRRGDLDQIKLARKIIRGNLVVNHNLPGAGA